MSYGMTGASLGTWKEITLSKELVEVSLEARLYLSHPGIVIEEVKIWDLTSQVQNHNFQKWNLRPMIASTLKSQHKCCNRRLIHSFSNIYSGPLWLETVLGAQYYRLDNKGLVPILLHQFFHLVFCHFLLTFPSFTIGTWVHLICPLSLTFSVLHIPVRTLKFRGASGRLKCNYIIHQI